MQEKKTQNKHFLRETTKQNRTKQNNPPCETIKITYKKNKPRSK